MSRSINLWAFCTAVPVSVLVEVLRYQHGLSTNNAALGVDFLNRQFASDLLVLAELGVSAGEWIIKTELDGLFSPRPDDKRTRHLHGAERKARLENGTATNGMSKGIV